MLGNGSSSVPHGAETMWEVLRPVFGTIKKAQNTSKPWGTHSGCPTVCSYFVCFFRDRFLDAVSKVLGGPITPSILEPPEEKPNVSL